MSTSQTVNAYSRILDSLCDIRVDKSDLASIISRASYEEQLAVSDFVHAYMRHYSMEHERGNYVNANMNLCHWAWHMVNGIDKQDLDGVE